MMRSDRTFTVPSPKRGEGDLRTRLPRTAKLPRGAALLAVTFLLLAISGLIVAMLQITTTNRQYSTKTAGWDASYFAAQAGVKLATTEMIARYRSWKTSNPTGDLRDKLGSVNPYLSTLGTWTALASTDPVVKQLSYRYNPVSGTNVSISPVTNGASAPVYRMPLTGFDWSSLILRDRFITKVYLYRFDRDTSGYKASDLIVVAEAQRNLGYSSGAAQVAALSTNQQTTDGEAVWVAQALLLTNPPGFTGNTYAILTKNIDCACCHMTVNSLPLAMNHNAALDNTFGRVKVGATQNLSIRSGSANTTINGTLYQRGALQEESTGAALSVSTFVTCGNMKCAAFNSNQTIDQNASTGAIVPGTLVNATTSTDGHYTPVTYPPSGGNLYLNYSTNSAQETDGLLPSSSFPQPFPGLYTPGNRTAAITSVVQSIYTDNTITGGIALTGFTASSQYAQTTLPSSGSPANFTQLGTINNPNNAAPAYTGNVVLVGTQSNPLQLNGQVVIDGDVMVSGYVQGQGQIYATGNIYVPGNFQYNDGTDSSGNETFGQTTSGKVNLAALVAGGNIVIGDYISQVNHWSSAESWFYSGQAAALGGPGGGFPEPGKKVTGSGMYYPYDTGSTLDGASTSSVNEQTSGKDLNVNGSITNTNVTVDTVNMANFVMEELSLFNRDALTNALPKVPAATCPSFTTATNYTTTNPNYDPNYTPVFYSFYPYNSASPSSTPIEFYLWSGHNGWDSTNNMFNNAGDPHTYNCFTSLDQLPTSILSANAQSPTVLSVHPSWVSPTTMMQLVSNVANSMPANQPRRLDGLLYTNNAIFAIERRTNQSYNAGTGKWSKVASQSGGRMTVNGSIICPDLGILVTQQQNGNSFTVNYDPRVSSLAPMTGGNGDWGLSVRPMTRNQGAFTY